MEASWWLWCFLYGIAAAIAITVVDCILKIHTLPAGYGHSCNNLPPLSCDTVAIDPCVAVLAMCCYLMMLLPLCHRFHGWLFFNMLGCGHQCHHLLPLCFDLVAVDSASLCFDLYLVCCCRHSLFMLPVGCVRRCHHLQLCSHQACIAVLWWLLTGVGSAVAVTIVITAVDSNFHQSWSCHWFGSSCFHHSRRQAQIGVILHFFVKVIRRNGGDIARWHVAMWYPSLRNPWIWHSSLQQICSSKSFLTQRSTYCICIDAWLCWCQGMMLRCRHRSLNKMY